MNISRLLALLIVSSICSISWAIPQKPVDVKSVHWKALYQQLFVWNVQKEMQRKQQSGELATYNEQEAWLKRVTYYNPMDANEFYNTIVSQPTSEAMSEKRETILNSQDSNFNRNRSLNRFWNLRHHDRQELSGLMRTLEYGSTNRDLAGNEDNDYFRSPIGSLVMQSLKDHILVVIPGFGSHTMTEYSFPEIVEQANAFYGRPLLRPSKPIAGDEKKRQYQAPVMYYATDEVGFDVVHPMGFEMGNTMGKTKDVADHLATWLRNLPAAYTNKKLILVGYSKGAPTALHMVQQHADMRERTTMIVSLAGAMQGAVSAQSGLATLEKSIGKDVDRNESYEDFVSQFGGYASLLGADFLTDPSVAELLSLFDIDIMSGLGDFQRFMESEDRKLAMEGVRDLSPYESVKWSLNHLNNEDLGDLTVFNISMITNRMDYVLPGTYDGFGPVDSPVIAPQFDPETGNLVWDNFSKDNVFLYLSSLGGFRESPGGLFDTQVAWMDTKSLALDARPLNHSVDAKHVEKLYQDRLAAMTPEQVKANPYMANLEAFASTPRNEMLNLKDHDNVHFVDLADMRGTHWDFAFRQVFTPKDKSIQNYYRHDFPRKAFLTALLETLAIYNYVKEEQK